MKAYLNNPALKERLLNQLTITEDDILSSGRECMLGYESETDPRSCGYCPTMAITSCSKLQHYIPVNFERITGIPARLACINCIIFCFMNGTDKDRLEWARNFYSSIPVGADLSNVWPRLVNWMMLDESYGVINHVRTPQQKGLVQKVAEYYQDENWPDQDPELLCLSLKVAVRELWYASPDKGFRDANQKALDLAITCLLAVDVADHAGYAVLHYPRIASIHYPQIMDAEYFTAFQRISDKIIDLLEYR